MDKRDYAANLNFLAERVLDNEQFKSSEVPEGIIEFENRLEGKYPSACFVVRYYETIRPNSIDINRLLMSNLSLKETKMKTQKTIDEKLKELEFENENIK